MKVIRVSRVLAAGIACVFMLTGVVSSQSGSDLLRSDGATGPKGKETATFTLSPFAGPSVSGAILGSGELFDLLGTAAVANYIEEPAFDTTEFPGGPPRIRLIFAPVTLEPNQKFFGLVGIGDPEGTLTDNDFRNDVFSQYQVEVDGVAMSGDRLRLGTPFPAGGETVHYFDVSQQIANQGTHDVVYRFVNKKTLGDCNDDCFPAGIWSFEFVVNIEKSKGGHGGHGPTTTEATGVNARSVLRGIHR